MVVAPSMPRVKRTRNVSQRKTDPGGIAAALAQQNRDEANARGFDLTYWRASVARTQSRLVIDRRHARCDGRQRRTPEARPAAHRPRSRRARTACRAGLSADDGPGEPEPPPRRRLTDREAR